MERLRRLSAGAVHHRWPRLAPDGAHIAFAVGDDPGAWVIVDRRGRIAHLLAGPAEGGASFSAEGTLVFGRLAGDGAELWMADAHSSMPVRLLGGDGRYYGEPTWSPDGAALAFACGDSASRRRHLELLEIASGRRRVLTADPERCDARPAFSPDGVELYFEGATRSSGGSREDVAIYALHIERNELERVTPERMISRHPAPLGGGLVIVERELEDGLCGLMLLDHRRGRERLLTDADQMAREPSVTRVGRRQGHLVYSALHRLDGEPGRYDVFLARLTGLPALAEGARRAGANSALLRPLPGAVRLAP